MDPGCFSVYSVFFFPVFLGALTLDTGFPPPSCLPYNTCFIMFFLHDLYLLTHVLAFSQLCLDSPWLSGGRLLVLLQAASSFSPC